MSMIKYLLSGVLAMSVVISGRTWTSVQLNAQDNRHELANTIDPLSVGRSTTWELGDGAGAVNHLWHGSFTIEPGFPVTLDLTAMIDAFGNPVNFDRINVIDIYTDAQLSIVTTGADGWDLWVKTSMILRAGTALQVSSPGGWQVLNGKRMLEIGADITTAHVVLVLVGTEHI